MGYEPLTSCFQGVRLTAMIHQLLKSNRWNAPPSLTNFKYSRQSDCFIQVMWLKQPIRSLTLWKRSWTRSGWSSWTGAPPSSWSWTRGPAAGSRTRSSDPHHGRNLGAGNNRNFHVLIQLSNIHSFSTGYACLSLLYVPTYAYLSLFSSPGSTADFNYYRITLTSIKLRTVDSQFIHYHPIVEERKNIWEELGSNTGPLALASNYSIHLTMLKYIQFNRIRESQSKVFN